MTRIQKGTRVRLSFFQIDDPPGCLAGAQTKFTAKQYDLIGTVRHVRGDAPTEEASSEVRLWIEAENPPPTLRTQKCEKCGVEEIPNLSTEVITGVLP